MATAVGSQSSTSTEASGKGKLRVYMWLASALSISVVMVVVVRGWNGVTANLGAVIVWSLAAAVADLFAVRLRRSITLTMSFTVTLAAAMVLAPAQAALVAFIGSIDRRELRGELSLSQVLFNRGQVACATTAAALVVAQSPFQLTDWPAVLTWALLALAADFLVNSAFVVSWNRGSRQRESSEGIQGLTRFGTGSDGRALSVPRLHGSTHWGRVLVDRRLGPGCFLDAGLAGSPIA